jgi:hypothetical protein
MCTFTGYTSVTHTTRYIYYTQLYHNYIYIKSRWFTHLDSIE